jgi:inorganic pyrophosphatase
MKKMPFYGKVKDGVFTYNRLEIFSAYCQYLRDGDYTIEISRTVASKTNEQLGYFHAVVVPTVFKQMQDDGNDSIVICIKGQDGEPHKYKEIAMTEEVVVNMLKEVWAKHYNCEVKSKADMNIEEASQLIDTSIQWAARYLGCVIPPPQEAV